jgi:predicted ATPase
VWWCDLTEAVSVADICHAIGKALGVALTHDGVEGGSVEQLGRALGGRGPVLVLLDNVEQLVEHIPDTLGRWLELAPQARFLVTSRAALLLEDERTLELGPLELPAAEDSSLEAIARAEAVRLFVQRARAAQGHYELTAEEAPLVAEIVRRLEGIALAIELAAARTTLLGVGQLRERLSRRFELLCSGRRDAVARQATLWGAIDWSWSLLSPAEQVALAQCSVFRGGFTLEAAEQVLSLPSGEADVLEVIQSLRSKSLLRAYAPDGLRGELRLGMYESIREYAAARLVERGDGAALVARHGDFYLELARCLRDPPPGSGGEALRRLALERENLLAVCDQALAVRPLTPESVSRALGVLVALEPDVVARGPVDITLPRLDRAMVQAVVHLGDSAQRAEALAVRGRAHLELGQLPSARRDLERARAIFHELGAENWEKRLLVDLSIVSRHEGDVAEAWRLVEAAQELSSGGDRWLDAYAIGNLGIIELVRSGASAAVPHLRIALNLFRAAGDTTFEVTFLINTALAIGEAGRTEEAMDLLEEAMGQAIAAGHRAGHAFARLNLGCFLLDADRAMEAREHLESVVQMGRQLGMRLVEGCAQGELGRASLATGDMEAAQGSLTGAMELLAEVSRWNWLRFSAHLAAVQAARGDLAAARKGFAELEVAPELREDPILRELASLLRTSLSLAEARAAPPGSEEAERGRREVRERLERARGAPPSAASSDLRGWLRLLEQWLRVPG